MVRSKTLRYQFHALLLMYQDSIRAFFKNAFVIFRVGGDSSIQYLVLQVHYGTIDHIPADGDDSGVFVHYTEKQLRKTAGVILMGTAGK